MMEPKVYYFHDEKGQKVYRIGPVNVSAQMSKHRPPRYEGCGVSAEIRWVSARWEKIDGVGYRHEYRHGGTQSFDDRDTTERAEEWFLASTRPPESAEITGEQYEELAAQYRAAAAATGQPEPDPPRRRPDPPPRRRRRAR